MHLSRFFTLDELTHSNTAKSLGIPNLPNEEQATSLRKLANAVLDPLREAVGGPLKVNSGYRSPQLNARIPGSSSTSQHSLGQAADLQSADIHILELFKTVIRLGLPYDQVIYEAKNATSKWVHVSHKEGANRGEIRVAKFDAQGKPLSYPLVTAEQALAMVEPVIPGQSRGPADIVELQYEEHGDEPVSETAPGKKSSARKAAPAKKAAAKKAPAKKAAAAKPGTVKVAAKTSAPTKASAKKVAAKKAPAKKSPATKAPAKKAPAKKAAAKSVVTKKAPAKKAPVKKAPVKKAAAKKSGTPAGGATSAKRAAKPIAAKPASRKTAAAKPAARKAAARKPAARKASGR